MFRPIAAIIRFSFESMAVTLIGLVWLYRDSEISIYVMFAIVKGHGWGVYTCDVRYPGVYSSGSKQTYLSYCIAQVASRHTWAIV